MDEDGLFILIFVGGLGVILLIVGVVIRLGIWRAIYAVKGYPVYMPRALVSVGIPLALTALSIGLVPILPIAKENRGDVITYVTAPLLIITYILAMWQPWWLKPAWLRWLEKEHGDIIHLLWEDVRQDRWGWERRVRTQEALETWVAEVRRKHGLEQTKPQSGA